MSNTRVKVKVNLEFYFDQPFGELWTMREVDQRAKKDARAAVSRLINNSKENVKQVGDTEVKMIIVD